jgi:hypothetical protein
MSTAAASGLRLRGEVVRRVRRSLKSDLELVVYTVASANAVHHVEDLTMPGGPYLSMGEDVDLEVVVNTFTDKRGSARTSLRIARREGEF